MKGLFIPEITAEMFRNGCLESIEALMAEGEIYDIECDPSADVVEVVRCADCVYWQDNNGGYPHEECRWGHDETPDADDYCSYGERK